MVNTSKWRQDVGKPSVAWGMTNHLPVNLISNVIFSLCKRYFTIQSREYSSRSLESSLMTSPSMAVEKFHNAIRSNAESGPALGRSHIAIVDTPASDPTMVPTREGFTMLNKVEAIEKKKIRKKTEQDHNDCVSLTNSYCITNM